MLELEMCVFVCVHFDTGERFTDLCFITIAPFVSNVNLVVIIVVGFDP